MSRARGPADEPATLVGLLDELLDEGVNAKAYLVIGLADVELVRASLQLLVASEDTAQRTGVPGPATGANSARELAKGVSQLVLTVVELLHDLIERQAVRRVEADTLTDEQVERLGVALQALEERMEEVKDAFGVSDEDLNIDLGPLGKLR